ncbi:hypothetical protein HWV62_31995 [Athelia sp. TMB]|nr:hypothetical protein HWV62_31995 [Athelia sp. TMB]
MSCDSSETKPYQITRAQWKNGGEVRWDEETILSSLSTSDKITFNLMRERSILSSGRHKASEGSLEVTVAQLLEKSLCAPNEDVGLALLHKGKETCKLTLRIAASSTAAALSSAMDPLAAISAQLLESGQAVAVADAMDTAGVTLTAIAQSDLVASLTTLVDNLAIVVKIGDEIAKIHPWASLAWNVLSVGLKLVKGQQDRDNNIAALAQTMQSTYSIVVGSESLKDERVQDVLDRILKQTVVSGFFIQDYARSRTFASKAITEPFSDTDGLVARHQAAFQQLRAEFTGRVATQTALALAHLATTVNEIRFDQLLDKLKPATMDQSARGTCLPGTRLDAIDSVLNWYSDDSDNRKSVMWLHGLAGAGKSTLSTTIARMMDRFEGVNLLGAFFFFNRDLPQWNASTLIRTLAYQLAEFDATIGARIEQILRDAPNITNQPLAIQFSKLLSSSALGDIPWSKGPVLVVIDALDESGTVTEREALMKVLSGGVSKLPRFFRLLIVSRRERDIVDCFNNSMVRQEELKVDPKTSRADIAAFIRSRLNDARERNIAYLGEALNGWPSDSDVNGLVDLASGHFIWAHTACRMIDIDDDPKDKLADLIRHQSVDTSDNSFQSLYQLYKTALQSAVQWNNRGSRARARDLLGAVICAQVPLSCVAIDDLIGRHLLSLQTVSRLGSVLSWTNTGPIRILHTSFYDYLTLHSTTEPWALNVNECNLQLAYGCISLLAQELRENICGLVLPHPVKDETLPEATNYAARFWVEHVCLITNPSIDLADKIDQFLRSHLLHWMESLSIMKAHDVVMRSLAKLLQCIQKYFPGSELYDFVYDADRFARYFASTIIEHPLLVYTSALPFTPRDTIVFKTFYNDTLPHVVSGVEHNWPPLLQMLYGHEDTVNSVSFSPDGSRIVSGSSDKTVRVWDLVTGQQALSPLEGHQDKVWSVSFSPDGSRIVSGSEDQTVRVWDGVTGQEALPPLKGHVGGVHSVAFSPDGRKIVSGSSDHTVRMWDSISAQSALFKFEGHEQSVNDVAFSPDGCMIVSASDDKTLRVWDTATGQAALSPLEGHEGAVSSVSISPDGLRIVSGSHDRTVRVWDIISGRQSLSPLEGHQDTVWSVSFSPHGSRIVSGSDDQTMRVWDAVTGEEANPPFKSYDGVMSVSFSPDGSKIVSASDDQTMRVWNAVTSQATLLPLQGHDGIIISLSFSPDGSRIASGSTDNTVRVWDVLTGQAAFPPLKGHLHWVQTASFSPDGSRIVSGSNDGTVRVWDAIIGRPALPPLEGHKGPVFSVSFSADGSRIVSGSEDKTVRVWDSSTGHAALLPLEGHQGTVWSVSFSPDGCRIVSGSDDKTVRVWDAVTGQAALPPLEGHQEQVWSVDISPDGSRIVSGSNDHTVRVWNAFTGQAAIPPLQSNNGVISVSFSPDGSRIISQLFDNTLRVWDACRQDDEGRDPKLVCSASDDLAQILVSLDQDGYFKDATSGRYLGKLPAVGSVSPQPDPPAEQTAYV